MACAPAAPAPRAVVLITIDTLRADRPGVYGGTAPTPRLDALARRGVWFTRARTVVPLTLPSHATILTGLHPLQHGVHNNGSFRLGPRALTLAEILHARGWRTGAVVGSFILDAQFGLDQGFETYDGPAALDGAPGTIEGPERDAAAVTEAALRWLSRRDGTPFFLWAHYFDPHTPYSPPEPFRSAHPRSPYDGEVAYVDQEIGRLLDALDAAPGGESALVAVVSDHGESLGEHGEATHGLFLYEAVLRVPFLLAGPGVAPRGADASEASTLDLLPTLLARLGIPAPEKLPGRDLLASTAAGGGAPGPARAAASAPAGTRLPCLNFGWSGSEAIAARDLKLIRGAGAEIYDLAADPHELDDLSAGRPADRERLEALLEGALASLRSATTDGGIPGSVTAPEAETRTRLESLGYLAGGGAPPGDCRSGPDPRRMLPVLSVLDRGVAEYQAGRHEAAAAAFREVKRLDPRNPQALYYLATALRRLGRAREAASEFAAASRLDPTNLVFLQDEASAWYDLGDLERAESRLRDALALHPESPKTRFFLGNVLLARGRAAQALAEYEAARAAMPPAAEVEFQRGRALLALGRRAGAIEALRAACALAPDRAEWHGTLAGLLAAEGRPAEALVLLRAFLDRHPGDPLALYNLAVLLESGGHSGEALRLYRGAAEAWTGDPARLESIRARIRRLESASRTEPRR